MEQAISTPKNYRIYAIGDVHGRLDLLTRLLAMIEADALQHADKTKKLVFLGDYIDRGLDSRGVLNRLCAPFAQGLDPVFLRGNHDDRMVRFLDGQLGIIPPWLQFGGVATFASYGVNAAGANTKSRIESVYADFKAKVPQEHVDFLNDTLYAVTFGDYYFVHAGIHPDKDIAHQVPEDQMWIREPFLSCQEEYGKVVVHGHTICTEPENHHNRIAIDTGAFASGCLTCLVLDGTDRAFFTT